MSVVGADRDLKGCVPLLLLLLLVSAITHQNITQVSVSLTVNY
jgi:hypothetical protein